MTRTPRKFESSTAVRGDENLWLGLVGPSSSGKTFSALRLATGIQRVFGGEIFYIDTESGRAKHYADDFKFEHVPFKPPFGPMDYWDCVQYCIGKGAKVIVIDSMTHEHNGDGGVMDQSEKYLDNKCGNDEGKRARNFALSLKKPKGERKRLKFNLVQTDPGVAFIFCYRAQEKMDFKKKDSSGGPRAMGWQPETTSDLHFEMAARFLLPPGSEGVPNLLPETKEEKMLTKNEKQFQGWLKNGVQLSEEIGEAFATWAKGSKPSKPDGNAISKGHLDEASKALLNESNRFGIDGIKKQLETNRHEITDKDWQALMALIEKRSAEVSP